MSECGIILKPYQINAIDRFVRRCRYQRGSILLHSMGSGKTLTSIYILRNLGMKHRWVIVTPKGLEGDWIDEFKRFGITGYEENTTFMSYQDLEGCNLTYSTLFKNSMVVISFRGLTFTRFAIASR